MALAINGACAIYVTHDGVVASIAGRHQVAAASGWTPPVQVSADEGHPDLNEAATGTLWQSRLAAAHRRFGWLVCYTERSDRPLAPIVDGVAPLLTLFLAQQNAPVNGDAADNRNLLAEAIHRFNEFQQPEPALQFIVQRVTELLDGDRGVLRLISEGRDRLDLGALYARDPANLDDLRAQVEGNIRMGERVAGRVAISGEPMIVHDPPPRDLSTTLLGTTSLLSLPLRNSTEVIGTLTVGFNESQQFLPQRLENARQLANLATLVLETARQHAKMQRQAREAMGLFEVARALTSTMSVREILHQITARAAELLDVQYCVYCRYDPDTGELVGEVGHGAPPEEVAAIRMPMSPLATEARTRRRAVYASDAPADPRVNIENVRRFGIRSVLCAPLLIKDRFLGVIYLYDKERYRVFEPDELDLMTNFTTYAVVAIENSNLHEGLQRTLDQLLVLYQTGRDISSSLELDSVVEAVTRSLAHLFSADYYAIAELAGDGEAPRLLAGRGNNERYLVWREQAAVQDALRRVLQSQPQQAGVVGPLVVTDPATGTPAGYLRIVPLRARGRVVGAIEIFAERESVAGENHDLLLAIGTAAGAAIEHAKLYAVVRDQQRQLQGLVESLITAQEEERRRAAYDIHDGLAQIIVSADQYLQTYQELHLQGSPRAGAMLDRGLHFLNRAIAESRRIISHLRPPGLDDLGLVSALEEYLGEVREETGVRIELVNRLGGRTLTPATETTVYRIVQEAVANARKYARPERIRVSLTVPDGQLLVEVRDWGCGFDPAQIERTGRSGRGIGLVGMQERARLIGGTCQVQSVPHQGTRVRVTIPLDPTRSGGPDDAAATRPRRRTAGGTR